MKKIVKMVGKLLFPLKMGECAAILRHDGKTILTPAVVKIINGTKDTALFETRNSVYQVVLIPFPMKAALSQPLTLCA